MDQFQIKKIGKATFVKRGALKGVNPVAVQRVLERDKKKKRDKNRDRKQRSHDDDDYCPQSSDITMMLENIVRRNPTLKFDEVQLPIAKCGVDLSASSAPFIWDWLDDLSEVKPHVGFLNSTFSLDSESLKSMNKLSDSIQNAKITLKMSTDTEEVVDRVLDTVTKVTSSSPRVEHSVVFPDSPSFGGFFDGIVSNLSPPVVTAIVVALAIAYYKGYIDNTIAVGAFISYCTLKFGLPALGSLLEIFTSTKALPQSMSTDELSSMIAGICNTCLCAGSATKIFEVQPMYSLINACSRVTLGIKPIVDLVFQAMSYIRYCISKYVFSDPMVIFRTGHEFLDRYLFAYEEIRLQYEDKTLYSNDTSLDRVRTLIADGEQIALRLPTSRETLTFKFRINESLSKLETIKKSLLATNFKYNGIRQEPVGILMRGPPGCGKSLTMQHLAHAIAAQTFTPEDLALYKDSPWMFIYNRQAENIYWEGYDSMKRIMFLDDILQARDVAGTPDNEVMNVIRAINVFENQLHCATIESKGNTTFRSHFVVANTNMQNINFESINDKGAFMRRWDIVVDVCPKEQYSVNPNDPVWERKLDLSKVPTRLKNDLDVTDLNPELLEYHVQSLSRGNFVPQGVCLDFTSFVYAVVSTYKKKTAWNDIYMDSLKETLAKFEGVEPQSGRGVDPYYIVSEELLENIDPLFTALRHFNRERYDILLGEVYYFAITLHNEYRIEILPTYWALFSNALMNQWFDSSGTLVNGFPVAEYTRANVTSVIYKVLELESITPQSKDDTVPIIRSTFDVIRTKLPKLEGIKAKMLEYFEWLKPYFPLNTLKVCLSYIDKDVLQTAGIFGIVGLLALIYRNGNKPIVKEITKDCNNIYADTTFYVDGFDCTEVDKMLNELPQSGERVMRSRRARVPQIPRSATLQSLAKVNTNLVDVVHSIARRNVVEFWAPVGRDSTGKLESIRFGFALGVCGRTIIFPYHFISQVGAFWLEEKKIKDDDPIEIRRVESPEVNFTCTVSEFFRGWVENKHFEENEVAIVKLGRACAPFRNITHMFVPEDRLQFYGNVDAVLSLPFDTNRGVAKEMVVVQALLHKALEINAANYEPYTIQRTFAYRAPCSDGDCGALLYADDPRSGASIIGFHVAGVSAKRMGFSTILTKEMMERVLTVAEETYKCEDQFNLELSPAPSLPNKMSLGCVSPQFSRKGTGETKLRRSVLYGGWMKPLTAPAPLKPFYRKGERINPMVIANARYGVPMMCIPEHVLEEARDSLYSMLLSTSRVHVEKKILTFEEAVLGDNSGLLKSVPRSTSAGFPYNCSKGLRTKERFFGKGPVYSLDSEECNKLRAEVELVVEKALEGVRLSHIFVDCEKDERRPLEKVYEGLIRMFSGSPSALYLAWRMYYGSFQKWILANTIDNGTAIAINEYSRDWDYLARKVLQKGTNSVGAGDFKAFDASETANIHWMILDIINQWYGNDPIGNQVRTILWYEVVNSLHLNKDTLYMWCSSLASGHPGTIFINTLYGHMSFRVVWVQHYGTAAGFNEHMYVVFNGDDHLYSVADDLQDVWTEKFVQDSMARIGLKYAPEDKGKSVCQNSLRSIREVTFLKRSFVWDSTYRRWIAPLSLEVVLEIPFWVKSGAATLFDTEVNLACCFAELALHPKEVFEHWKAKIISTVEMVRDVRLPVETGFHTARRIVLSRGEVTDLDSSQPLRSASVWLRTLDNENSDVKSGYSLSDVNPFRVNDYCQDGGPAAQVMSRSQNAFGGLVEPQSKRPTAVSITKKEQLNVPEALGQGSANVEESNIVENNNFPATSTTHSTNDGVVETARPIAYRPLRQEDLLSVDTFVSQEVRDFLKKPYTVANGVFATTDVFTTNILTINQVFHNLINGNTKWRDKLIGNGACRGKIVLTLFVNGNRFQQGRYILAWVPDGGGANANSAVFVAGHSSSLCQVTQLPHVEIDINLDTTAILEIPFVNCVGWSGVRTNTPNMWDVGTIMIRTYSPLVAPTGSTSANWTLYAHLEDVEFKMPIVPHSKRGVTARVIKRTPAVNEEKSMGPVQDAFTKISQASGILTGVPIISSIAGPVEWASALAASAAAYFGWCKPRVVLPESRMVRNIFPKYNNCDSWDVSTKLSVSDANKVEEMCGYGGTDLDEMSLNYVASIPAYFQTLTWNETNASGVRLTTLPLSPRDFTTSSVYGGTAIFSPTPVSFVTNFFAQYRGSLKFTFKFVKTEFHSGRLLLCYYPFDFVLDGATPAVPTLLNTEYLHREIIDIRMGNEFTFTIPYASFSAYRSTCSGPTAESCYGNVYLFVLNPLVAPSSVSTTVSILVEVSGAEDMEWAFPRSIQEYAALPITPQSKANEIVSSVLGNGAIDQELMPARCCIGERIMSFRQLIKRYNPIVIAFPGAINSYFIAYPYTIFTAVITAAPVIDLAECQPDIYSTVGLCYALARGGIRYKWFDGSDEQRSFTVTNLPWGTLEGNQGTKNFTYQAATTSAIGGLGNGVNNYLNHTSVTGGLEVEYPYYHRTFAHPVSDVLNNAGVDVVYAYGNTAPRNLTQISWSSNPTSFGALRAAAEDASFSVFVSVPTFTSWNNSTS